MHIFNNAMMGFCILCICIYNLFTPGSLYGAGEWDAVIIDYKGKSDAFKINRSSGGTSDSILYRQLLKQGDTISVLEGHKGNWVKINYFDGRVVVILAADSPYIIQHSATSLELQSRNMWANYWEILSGKLNRTQKIAKQFGGARGSDSGLSINIPGLQEGNIPRISQKHKLLALSWHGGIGPYEIVLNDWTGRQVVLIQDISTREVKINLKEVLNLGIYEITISDKNGLSITRTLETVKDSTFPQFSLNTQHDWLADEIKDIAAAKQLIDLDINQFSYEAYLRLAPHRDRSETVSAIMKTMEFGLVLLAD